MKALRRMLRNLDETLIALLIGAICVVLIMQVFFRYALNSPLIWSEEVARHLFVWAVMLGLGYNVRKETSISLRLFFEKFPAPMRVVVALAGNALLMGVFGLCLPYAVRFTRMQHNILTTATEVPMSWVAASVPIGFAYLIVVLAYDSVRTVRRYATERRGA